ncbi:MAG TPA: tyrosine-protein phosphatase [Gaiellaceae bacterium]|nr:tyrosine-protein phosphatase [Gaiellaceae bacterium]
MLATKELGGITERTTSRDLVWDGILNVRDLGGHPTEDGRETQFGRIVRADNIRRLSDEGWRSLVDYGIRTVVDLRTEEELDADPPAELPVDVLHVPFMTDDPLMFERAEKVSAAVHDIATATRDVYLIFIEGSHDKIVKVIEAIVDAPEGGVVVHCAGGKDRTGLTVAFLLRIARLGLDEIAADYALSEDRLRPRHEQWLAETTDERELERLKRIMQTPAASMIGVLEELERRYGTIEGFLQAGGAPPDVGERVRARLLD